MNFNNILYETNGPIAEIALNRPDKLNAINSSMVSELHTALDQAEANVDIRAIILKGRGRAFSSGFDLDMGTDEEGDSHDPAFLRRELAKDFDIIMRFWDCPKPTIAAVHTYCLGSAMEMAVACDITIAEEQCRFGAPEVQFGSGIVALLMPWLTGPKKAKELLLTGDDKVTADDALAMGLINKVVDSNALDGEALVLAHRLAANDQLAVALTKQAINRTLDIMGFRQALTQALELDVLIEATQTPESKKFNEILERDGPKAAIAWRRVQFDPSKEDL